MQGLMLLQESIRNTHRPLSWAIGEDGSAAKYAPSQRDKRNAERMQVSDLAEPTTVGDAPLSDELLKRR